MNAERIFTPAFEAASRMERPLPKRTEPTAQAPAQQQPRRRQTAEEIILGSGEHRDAPSRGVFVLHVVVTLTLIALAAWFALR